MRRAAAIAVTFALAAAGASALASPPRHGRVVRVERPQHADKKRIRLCVHYGQAMNTGQPMLCIGAPAPSVGSEINLFEFNGPYAGSARVERTRRSTQAGCESDQVHEVYYSSTTTARAMVLGIIGMKMSAKSRVKIDTNAPMPAAARDGENRWLGFDVDGEGDIDLLLTMRKCDLDRPPGYTGLGQCLAYWVRDSAADEWRLHNEDAIYDCN